MKEPRAAWLSLATLAGCPTLMDDHGLVLKQAHKMGGFFTLSDPNLWRYSHTVIKFDEETDPRLISKYSWELVNRSSG